MDSKTPRKPPARTPGRQRKTPGRTPRDNRTVSKMTPHRPDQAGGEGEGIRVAIRMRPLNRNEGNHDRVWKVLKDRNSVAQLTEEGELVAEGSLGRHYFSFDRTFGEESTTTQVYDSVVRDIVSSALIGLNGTIFAYGQTSSGKTFTMQGAGTIEEGSSDGSGGVVHMTARDIFAYIEQNPDRVFTVLASFLEIYNEDVRDLLAENKTKTLAIREDPHRGVFVQCEEEMVTNYEALLAVLFRGESARAFATTAMNERSSRSHTIFRVTIQSHAKDADGLGEGAGAVRVSTLNLVDLAGSESVRHTGATGDRQKEGGMINTSLLTLSRVIVALSSSDKHVNYRDSKLTRLLQPSLQGNARMSIICCATPSQLYLEETRSTLSFASRAKLVKTNATINEVVSTKTMISRLQRDLEEARKNGGGEQVKQLQTQLNQLQNENKEQKERIIHLNLSHLGSEPADESSRCAKRQRTSIGPMPVIVETPKGPNGTTFPITAPRQSSMSSREYISPIPPNKENLLLRQALVSRGDTVKNLKTLHTETSRLLTERESELIETQSTNDVLKSEKDESSLLTQTLAHDVQELQDQLSAMENDYEKRLREKSAEFEHQLNNETAVRKSMQEALDSLRIDAQSIEKSLQGQLDDERTEVKRLEDSVAMLESTNGSLVECTEDLKGKLAVLEKENQDLKQDVEAKDAVLLETVQTHKMTVSRQEEMLLQVQQRAKSDNDSLQAMLDKVSAELEQKCDECEKQAEELEAMETGNQSLKGELQDVTKDMCFAKSEVEALSKRRDDLEKDLTSSNELAEGLKIQVEELTEDVRVQAKESEQEISSLRATMNEQAENSQHEIQELERDLDKQEDKMGALSKELEIYQNLSRVSESECAALTQELADLATQHEKLKTDLDGQSDLVSFLEADQAEKSGMIEKLSSSLSTAESNANELSMTRDNLVAEVDELTNQLEEEMKNSRTQKENVASTKHAMENEAKRHVDAVELLESELKEKRNEIVSLSEKLEGCHTKLADTEGELAATNQKLSEVAIDHALQKDEYNVLKTRSDELQVTVSSLGAEKSEKSEIIETLTCRLSTMESNAKKLEKARDVLSSTVDEVTRRLEDAVQQAKSQEEKIASVEESMGHATKKHEDVVALLESGLKVKRDEVTLLSEKLAQCHKKIAEAEGVSAETQQKLSQLTNDHNSQIEECNVLKTRIDELEAVVSCLEAEKSEKSAIIESLTAEGSELKKAMDGLSSTVDELKDRLEDALKQVKIQEEKVASTEEAMGEQTGVVALLESGLKEKRDEITSLSEKLEQCHAKIGEIEVESVETQQKLSQLTKDHAAQLDAYNALKSRSEEIAAERSAKFEVIESLTTEGLEMKKARDGLSSTVDELKNRLEDALKQVKIQEEKVSSTEEAMGEQAKSHEGVVALLESGLKEKRDEITSLSEKLKECRAKMIEAEGESAETQQELSQLTKDHASQLDAYNALKTRSEELAALVSSLEGEKSEKSDIIESLNCRVLTMESDGAELVKTRDDLSSTVSELKDRLEDALKHAKTQEDNVASLKEAVGEEGKRRLDATSLLQLELDEKRNEISSLSEKLAKAEGEIDDTRREISVLTNDHALQKEESNLLMIRSNDLSLLVSSLEADREEKCGIIEALESKLASVEPEASRLAKDKADLSTTAKALEGKISSLEESLRMTEKSHADELSLFESELKEKEDEIALLSEELEGCRIKMLETERKFVATTHELSDLTRDHDLLKEETSTVKQRNDELSVHVSSLTSRQSETSGQVDLLTARLLTVEAEALEARKSNEEQALIFASESTIQMKKIRDLENELETQVSEFKILDDRIEIEVEKSSALLTELESARAQAIELESRNLSTLSMLQGKLDLAEEEVSSLKGEADNSRQELCQKTEQLVCVLDEKNSVMSELAENKVAIEELHLDLDALRLKITKLRAELNASQCRVISLSGHNEACQQCQNRASKRCEALLCVMSFLSSCADQGKQLCGSLESQNQELKSAVEILRKDLKSSEINVSRIEASRDEDTLKQDTKMKEFTVALQETKDQCEQLAQSNSCLRNECARFRGQHEKHKSDADELMKKVYSLEEEGRAKSLEIQSINQTWAEKLEEQSIELKTTAVKLQAAVADSEMASQRVQTIETERLHLQGFLTAQTQSHADKCNTLQEQFRAKELLILELSDSRNEMEKEVDELKRKYSLVTKTASSARADNAKLKLSLASAQQSLKDASEVTTNSDRICQHLKSELESSQSALLKLEKKREMEIARQAASVSKTMYDTALRKLDDANAALHEQSKQLENSAAEKERLLRQVESKIAELREEKMLLQTCQNCILLEGETNNLHVELMKLKADVQDSEMQHSRELCTIQAENEKLESSIHELKTDLSKSRTSVEQLTKDLTRAKKEHRQTDACDMERATKEKHEISEVKRLTKELTSLQSKLRSQEEHWFSPDVVERLKSHINEQEKQLRSKANRIKKLEHSKLTKGDKAAIANMRKTLETKVSDLEAEKVAWLEKENNYLIELRSDTRASDVAGLQFEKAAIEKQLAKVVSLNQSLEEERGNVIQAMLSTGQFHPIDSTNIDVASGVYSLCDKLSSLQRASGSGSLEDTDTLRSEISSLQDENSALREKAASMSAFQSKVKPNNDDHELSFLRQENLNLMKALKTAKRQLDEIRAEVRMLKSQISSAPPIAWGASSNKKCRCHDSLPTIPEQKFERSPGPRQEGCKENGANARSDPSSTSEKLPRSTKKRPPKQEGDKENGANARSDPSSPSGKLPRSTKKRPLPSQFTKSSPSPTDEPSECQQS